MHLILDLNFKILDKLLKYDQMQKEKNSDIETNGKPKINYFLIRLPRNATEDEVKKIAKPCLLQYDSLVFGFKMNYGMDCLYCIFI